MPRRAPTGGRFAQPCVDPALPLCDLNSLWTHAYEKLMAENRRLLAANSSEPGTYLDYSNFLMASNVADNVLRRRDRALARANSTLSRAGAARFTAAYARRPPATLDLGCGGGFLMYWLRALGATARGVNPIDRTMRAAQLLPPTWRALGLSDAIRSPPPWGWPRADAV